MKRSNSAPCLTEAEVQKKRLKTSDEQMGPNTREYLQLALARVLELQRAVKDNTYFAENSSDIGDSDSDEDLMRDVLTRVFKDLPGSSASVPSIIERATRRNPPELNKVRGKSIQLSGYDACRKVALNFMKAAVKAVPQVDDRRDIRRIDRTRRRDTLSSEYEIRSRMLRGLDLHLAIKQRDYSYKLMKL
ncbi:uncharacterized protein LOC107037042 [Diachasma alloeum]|uniref:uncharacterized protein LOC107037042 n=1 Tax=Diachasma alloeum TaxID=454923 RepID=UPI0007382D4D|nr:uncharacterized protein LOC107037042 [Diachasma alloeum]